MFAPLLGVDLFDLNPGAEHCADPGRTGPRRGLDQSQQYTSRLGPNDLSEPSTGRIQEIARRAAFKRQRVRLAVYIYSQLTP